MFECVHAKTCVCVWMYEPCFLRGVWECVSPLSLLRSVWLPPSGRWRAGTAETRTSRQEVRNLLLKKQLHTHTVFTNMEGEIRVVASLWESWLMDWTCLESYESPPTPSRKSTGVRTFCLLIIYSVVSQLWLFWLFKAFMFAVSHNLFSCEF